jgi:hypothetical protein
MNTNKILKRSNLIDVIFAAFMAELGTTKVENLIEYAMKGLGAESVAVEGLEQLTELLVEQLDADERYKEPANQERGGAGMRFLATVITATREGSKLTRLDALGESEILLEILVRRVPQTTLREIYDDLDQNVSVKASTAVQELVNEIRELSLPKEAMLRKFKKELDPTLQGPTSLERQRDRPRGGRGAASVLAALTALLGDPAGITQDDLPEELRGLSGMPGVRIMRLDELFGGRPSASAFEDLLRKVEQPLPEPDGSVTVGDLWSEENQTFGLIRSVEDFLRKNRPRTDAINMDGVRGLPLRMFKDPNELASRFREVYMDAPAMGEMLVVLGDLIHADTVKRYGSIAEAIETFLAKHPERADAERKASERAEIVNNAVRKGEPTPGCDCPPCNAKRRARGGASVAGSSAES